MPDDEQLLRREAERLGISRNVTITGWLPMPEAWQQVRRAALCVSPYLPVPILRSTSPTKLIEYMALGKPVVANDHPEQADVLRESGAGLVCGWNEQEFAAAIVELLHGSGAARTNGSGRPPLRRRAPDALGHGGARCGPLSAALASVAETAEVAPIRARLDRGADDAGPRHRTVASDHGGRVPDRVARLAAPLRHPDTRAAVGRRDARRARAASWAAGASRFDWRYGIFLAVLLFTIVFGYAVQDVPDGAMLAGARSYLKFLPFFLLPAVHRFTPRQLHIQLMLLLVLALLQTPLALYQRFVEFASAMHTGDPVKGTLTTSSALSMFMVAAIAGAVVFYLRGRLRLAALRRALLRGCSSPPPSTRRKPRCCCCPSRCWCPPC